MNKQEFYVYVLLDPRENGIYKYHDLTFTNKPFYVGKGHDDRAKSHFRRSDKTNPYKKKIINEIKECGLEPMIEYVHKTNIEPEAYTVEIDTINKIGLDVLTNITYGGKGRDSQSMIGAKNHMFGKKRPKWIVDKLQKERQKTNKIDKLGKTLEEIIGHDKAKIAKQKMSDKRKGKSWNEYFGNATAERIKKERSILRTGSKHHTSTINKMRESALNKDVIKAKVDGALKQRFERYNKLYIENNREIVSLINLGLDRAETYKRMKTKMSRYIFNKIYKSIQP